MIINDAFFYSLQSTKTDTIMAATNEADGTDVSFFMSNYFQSIF